MDPAHGHGPRGRAVLAVPVRRFSLVVVLLWAFAASACDDGGATNIPDARSTAETSKLAPGDEFDVEVFDEEELSGTYQVQEDGTIDFPLLGRLAASGKTQADLATELESRLADGFLREPHVRVRILSRSNLEVSVLGQVTQPGTFPFIEKLTLVQAISDAGGMTPLANRRKVKLTRKTAEGPQTFEISLKAITEGSREDLVLQPGDIIFVPEAPI